MGRKWWWALIFVVAMNRFARAEDLGEEGFVDSQGVRIHYVTLGRVDNTQATLVIYEPLFH
jgi:hypothetical protein